VLPVHYSGHPCDLDALREAIGKRDVTVIEDAAHACGAKYKGQLIGSLAPMTCFSFHAVKNLSCGEGGAVFTDNDTWFKRISQKRWLGISKDTYTRSSKERVYAWQYWVNELGYKYHLHDISAAIGLVQLKRLEENNRKRRAIVDRYNQAFATHGWIETPPEQEYAESSWHIYHIKVPERDRLIAHLKRNNIAPGVHYYPIHLHPYYAGLHAQCPIAEQIWKRIVSLPVFPDMTEEQIDRVIDAVIGFEQSI
ncbi:DegT/DnrJ/EryC1/StrS aminotransferase family protein, partial [bacterium]|nr:DegT/DnrJ/EryC1/StrS aminotransferase family protein [bacterium]